MPRFFNTDDSNDSSDENNQKMWTTLLAISVPTVAAALAYYYFSNKNQQKTTEQEQTDHAVDDGDDGDEDAPLTIEQVLVYPVKSLRGMSVDSWPIGPRGLQFDRQWMIVQRKVVNENATSAAASSGYKTDAEYTLVSQRQLPRMALIGSKVDLKSGNLCMFTPGNEPDQVDDIVTSFDKNEQFVLTSDFYRNEHQFQRINVELWGRSFELLDLGDSVSEWLSRVMNKSGLRMCMLPRDLDRAPDAYHYDYLAKEYDSSSTEFKPVVQNSLSDDFPFHLATMNSLDELNSKLEEKVEMIRFRPNFVIGRNRRLEPYCEEKWKRIEIVQPGAEENPEATVHMFNLQVKTRCTMTNVNPATGKRSDYGPFQKLRETNLNRVYDQPIFGINTVNTEADVGKWIKKGSVVRVLDYHPEPVARVPSSN